MHTHDVINTGGGTYFHIIRMLHWGQGPWPQALLLSIAYPPSWGLSHFLWRVREAGRAVLRL